MKIEQTFSVAAPVERVWQFITDPEQVAPCVPGCKEVETLSDTDYRARVAVSIGPIRTCFDITITLTEMKEPGYVASMTRGEEGGKASTLSARTELYLEGTAAGDTIVRYSSDVSVFGRLGKFGLGMMKKKATTMGEDFARSLGEKLENTPS